MVSFSKRSSISARRVIGDKGLLLFTFMKECRKFKTAEVIGEGGGGLESTVVASEEQETLFDSRRNVEQLGLLFS